MRVFLLVAIGAILLAANAWYVRAVIDAVFGARTPTAIAPLQVIGTEDADEKLGTVMAHLLRGRLSRIRLEMESSQRSLTDNSLGGAPGAVGPTDQRATVIAIPDKVFEPFDVDLSVAGVEVGGILSWVHRLLAQDRMIRLVVEVHGDRATVVGNIDAYGGDPLYLETAAKTDAIVTDIAYTLMQREMSERIPEVSALELVEFRTLVSTLHDVASLNRRAALGRVIVGGYTEPLNELAELAVKTPRWRSLVHLTAQVAENAQAPDQALHFYEMELSLLADDDQEKSNIRGHVRRLGQNLLPSASHATPVIQAEDHDAAVKRIRESEEGQRILSMLGIEAGGAPGAPRVAILGGMPTERLLRSARVETVGARLTDAGTRARFEAGYVESLAQAVQLVVPDARLVFTPMEGTTDYYTQSELVNALQVLVDADPDVLLVTFGPLVGAAFEALARSSIKRGIMVVIANVSGEQATQVAAMKPSLYETFGEIVVVSAIGSNGRALDGTSARSMPANVMWAPGERVPVLPSGAQRIELRAGNSFAAALTAGLVGSLSTMMPGIGLGERLKVLRDSARASTTDGPPVIRLASARELATSGSSVDKGLTVRETREVNLAIPDGDPTGIESVIEIDASGTLTRILVSVSATHTYIGDLRIVLISPTGTEVILHDREGASGNDIVATYGSDVDAPLRTLVGDTVRGAWRLRMSDHAVRDVGTFNSWALEIEYEEVTDNE